jgi:acyl carrier protein
MSSAFSHDRLVECFAAVFPGLDAAQIRGASADSVEGWDSIALATLVATVEEQFDVTISPDCYADLDSFEAFARKLEEMR